MKRVSDCTGVLNEIVEVSKLTGLSVIRLQYVELLLSSCFKRKFTHGCEVWDSFNNTNKATINKLIPDTLKRVMELPASTPTLALQHDMGFIDIEIEVEMERVLLACSIEEMGEMRILKSLYSPMYQNQVPGFCTAVSSALKMFEIEGNQIDESDKRGYLKKKMVKIQKERMLKSMLEKL